MQFHYTPLVLISNKKVKKKEKSNLTSYYIGVNIEVTYKVTGGELMIKVNELKGRFVANGYTQEEIAKMLGMAPKTLSLKLKKGVMGSDEIEKLVEILNIENPWDLFFA